MKGLLKSTDYAELRQIIDLLGVVAFVIDVDEDGTFRLAAINKRHEQLTGLYHADVAGRRINEVLPPVAADAVVKNYRRCVEARTAIDYQESLRLPAGTTFWRTTLVPYMDARGRVYRMLGTSFEVSRTVHLELESRYQSTLLGAYLDESPDGILVVDADNHMKTWNRRFLEIWDIPEAVMEAGDGAAALSAVRGQLEEPDEFVDRVADLYEHLDREEHGYRFRMRDGRVFERYSRGLRDEQGAYWGRIWFYRDVTEREQMTEELLRLARTDVLTDTANRRAFMEGLRDEFRRAHRYRHPLSVLVTDLDHFKRVNDRYGHAGGDAALRAFADAVKPLLRQTDHLARMGGEEFAVLLPETGLAEARRIAERLRETTADLTIERGEDAFGITVSIGAVELSPADEGPEAALIRADRALYAAKAAGRNRVETG